MIAVLRDAGPGTAIVAALALIAFTAAATWPRHRIPAPRSSEAPGTSTPAAGEGAHPPAPAQPRPPGIFIRGQDIAVVHITRTCGCQETRDYQRGRITRQQCTHHGHFTQWAREISQ